MWRRLPNDSVTAYNKTWLLLLLFNAFVIVCCTLFGDLAARTDTGVILTVTVDVPDSSRSHLMFCCFRPVNPSAKGTFTGVLTVARDGSLSDRLHLALFVSLLRRSPLGVVS